MNVASYCGFTDDHYRELVELQERLGHDNFEVLAFPCNQFGKQEPSKNKYIKQFADDHYRVNFQMFAKIKTIGDQAHPLYKWLKRESGHAPNWNFCKYLVNAEGEVKKFEPASTSIMDMEDQIEDEVRHAEIHGPYLREYRDYHDDL